MYKGYSVSAVIPALNEEDAIAKVVMDLFQLTTGPNRFVIDSVVVCDNGSSDNTAMKAISAGAKVVRQETPGYGIACLTAIQHLPPSDIVLFIDGDDACFVEQSIRLLEGIVQGDDLAIGSRSLGRSESGALTAPQQFGNWLAGWLIQYFWGQPVSDLGPFRAIRQQALQRLDMQDRTFGWTVEMQVKALMNNLQMNEYPVDSKVRIGESKISGTVMGSIKAGIGILSMIAKLRFLSVTPIYKGNRIN